MSSRNVFAVVSGDYSDYTVHCLFDREDDARSYAAACYLAEARFEQRWDMPNNEPCSCASIEQHDGFGHSRGYRIFDVESFQLWSEVPIVTVGGSGELLAQPRN